MDVVASLFFYFLGTGRPSVRRSVPPPPPTCYCFLFSRHFVPAQPIGKRDRKKLLGAMRLHPNAPREKQAHTHIEKERERYVILLLFFSYILWHKKRVAGVGFLRLRQAANGTALQGSSGHWNITSLYLLVFFFFFFLLPPVCTFLFFFKSNS
jgi:hypothetical protein